MGISDMLGSIPKVNSASDADIKDPFVKHKSDAKDMPVPECRSPSHPLPHVDVHSIQFTK